MNYGFTVCRSQLFCLVAVLFSGCANAQIPNIQIPAPISALLGKAATTQQRTPEWVKVAQKGLELRKAKKLEEAAAAFATALEQLKTQEAQSDPSVIQYGLVRVDLRIAYGDVLNRLSRPNEALPVLLDAAAIEQDELETRSKRSTPSMSYLDAMAALQATMSNAGNMARHLNRKYLVIESDNGDPYEESLNEQLPDTLLTSLLLADTYSRKGDRAEVLKLYNNQFQAYLRRQRENQNPAARFNLDLAIETACIRFALVLARVGPSAEQEQAFQCALDLNFSNQRTIGTSAIVSSIQEESAAQRRLFVGAYADRTVRNVADDKRAQRRLVELIADSKGLHTRYIQRIRQLIFHSDISVFLGLRPRFDALESSRKELPVYGPDAVSAMVNWENSWASLMREALPTLRMAGIGDVFIDGASLLSRTQAKLGNDVLIGFSIYRPIDLNSLKPLPGRLLRYSVTNSEVEVQDIGTQKEFDDLVYRWRSAVAKSGDTTTIPLGERLLSGLPVAVQASKSWVIDPDGAIALVPFEALTEKNGNPLISGHSVRYVTSIASFATPSLSSERTSPTALLIANPQFSGDSKVTVESGITRSIPTASGTLLGNMRFNELPQTAIEAASIQESLKRIGVTSDMRIGERATLDAMSFKTAPRYLHIATHGIYMVPGTDPASRAFIKVATSIPGMQSALVFTPNAHGSIFTGADFARLPLKGTELVVLSACDTGNGALNAGEGVQSLRMSVEEAGAKTTVTSLWPVPSESTTKLMSTFYEQIGGGTSKSEALRNAKLQLMKTHPDPIHWAGFLLAGQP